MEIEAPVPVAQPINAATEDAPVWLAQPIGAAQESGEAVAPLAQPIGAAAEALPARDNAWATDQSNPFGLGSANVAAPPMEADGATATSPARRMPPAAKGGLPPRVLMAIVGGGVLLFVLLIGCSGFLFVNWLRGDKPRADEYPKDAEVQITDAFLSVDKFRMGDSKRLIVKIRRVKFDGPVELRFEGLPEGVTADKTIVPAGKMAEEVRITADRFMEPADTNIRIIGKAKNLTYTKEFHLQVLPEKKFLAPK